MPTSGTIVSKALRSFIEVVTILSAGLLLASWSILTSVNLWGVSLSALMTIALAFVLSLATGLNLRDKVWRFRLFFGQKHLLLLIPFVLWILIRLDDPPTQPGLQVLLVTACLIFGILAFTSSQLSRRFDVALFLMVCSILGSIAYLATSLTIGSAPFLDPRSYAMTALLGLALALSKARGQRANFIWVVLILVAIFWSGSRMASIAAILGVSFAISSMFRGQVWGKVAAGFVSMGIASALLLTTLCVNSAARNRWNETGDGSIQFEIAGSQITLNSSGRVDAWREFISQIQTVEHWVFGRGSGFSAEYGTSNLLYFPNVLNEYLRIIVDFGVVGFLLFSGWLFACFVTFVKGRSKPFGFAALLSLFMVSIVAATDAPFLYPFIVIPLAVIVGLAESESEDRLAGPFLGQR